MYLTGEQFLNLGMLTNNAVTEKVDDGHLPSFGPDGVGYTLRGDFSTLLLDFQWSDQGDIYFWLPPLQSTVVKSVEYVKFPNNMLGHCLIKSTYGRQLLILLCNAAVDPGYRGRLTIGLFNASNIPVPIYIEGGLCTLLAAEIKGEHQYEGRHQDG